MKTPPSFQLSKPMNRRPPPPIPGYDEGGFVLPEDAVVPPGYEWLTQGAQPPVATPAPDPDWAMINALTGRQVAGGRGGFAQGGFTGPGPKHQPAGIVHAGEFVIPKEAVEAIGVRRLDMMFGTDSTRAKTGYARGGLVGGMDGGLAQELPPLPPLRSLDPTMSTNTMGVTPPLMAGNPADVQTIQNNQAFGTMKFGMEQQADLAKANPQQYAASQFADASMAMLRPAGGFKADVGERIDSSGNKIRTITQSQESQDFAKQRRSLMADYLKMADPVYQKDRQRTLAQASMNGMLDQRDALARQMEGTQKQITGLMAPPTQKEINDIALRLSGGGQVTAEIMDNATMQAQFNMAERAKQAQVLADVLTVNGRSLSAMDNNIEKASSTFGVMPTRTQAMQPSTPSFVSTKIAPLPAKPVSSVPVPPPAQAPAPMQNAVFVPGESLLPAPAPQAAAESNDRGARGAVEAENPSSETTATDREAGESALASARDAAIARYMSQPGARAEYATYAIERDPIYRAYIESARRDTLNYISGASKRALDMFIGDTNQMSRADYLERISRKRRLLDQP